jgi:triosephosphate isomerase
MVQEVHSFIRRELVQLYGEAVAQGIRIVYGGSVNKTNAKDLLKQPDIDGLLVGGASLDPGHFLAICEQVSEQAMA